MKKKVAKRVKTCRKVWDFLFFLPKFLIQIFSQVYFSSIFREKSDKIIDLSKCQDILVCAFTAKRNTENSR